MKKHISLLLAALLLLGCLAGCGGAGGTTDKGSRSTTVKFSYYAGGYGDAWLKAVAEDYMSINQDVYIELIPSYDNTTAQSDILSGSASADLYQIEVGMFGNADYLLELDDVYDAKAYGEETLIKDKCDEGVYDFYNEDGRHYQLPATARTGWNWVYNKTVLDEVYGADNYQLPRTTDELFRLGDDLFSKQTFLTVAALADTQGGDYTSYLTTTWFAQMTGVEGYRNYVRGNYQDGSSYKLAEDSPRFIAQNKTAIEEAYAVAYKLGTKKNHYLYSDSDSLAFKGADQVFYGGGYGMNKSKVAMMYIGAWIENEVEDLIQDGIVQPQELCAIKMPVISAIIRRTPSIPDEATLVQVIDFVDGKGAAPAGVSEADIAIIREARNLVCENCCRSFVVPKNTKNAEAVKDFLRYLASDRAQKLSAQNANGLSRLPFGYKPSAADGFQFTGYVQSLYDKMEDSVVLDVSGLDNPMASIVDIQWCYDKASTNVNIVKTIFGGNATAPADIYGATLAHYDTAQWKTYIESYKTKMKG